MIRYRRCTFILLFLFLVTVSVIPNAIKVEHVLKDSELSESYILSICKDSYGFIWLGTYSGVYRFDGYECISPFNKPNKSSELENKSVQCIYEDSDSNLWFGTETGLYKFNRTTGEILNYHYGSSVKELSNEHIRVIHQNGDKFYLGTYGGGLIVFYSSENRFETYSVPSNHPKYPLANRVNGFLQDRQGKIWIATEAGTFTIDENLKKYYTITGNGEWPEGKTINCFYEDQENNIWIGTWDDGLYCYKKDTEICHRVESFSKKASSSQGNIRSILPVDAENLWLANFWDGLYNYNLRTQALTKVHFSINEPANTISLWTMLKDDAGLIWFGGFGIGLYKYSPVINQFKPFPEDNTIVKSVPNAEISAFSEDQTGNIFIGTSNEGVFKFNSTTKKITSVFKDSDPRKNIIRVLYTDTKDRVWVGAEEYLACIENSSVKIYENQPQRENSFGKSGVHAIWLDKSGKLWSSVWGWGLYVLSPTEMGKQNPQTASFKRFVNLANSDTTEISDNIIWAIAEDKKGKLYFGTSNSLDYYDSKTEKFQHLMHTTPSSIYIDDEDVIWVGTFGYGLIKYTPWDNKVEYFNKENGLQSNIVNGILKGKSNELIIITDLGLSRFIKDSKRFVNYNSKSDLGLKKMLPHAFIRLKNGTILIGSDESIVGFNPEGLSDKLASYPVYLTDINVFNKSVLDEKKIYDLSNLSQFRFSHTDKMISFEFVALDFSSPEKVKYAYRLEGFDDEWIQTDSRNRVATYTNLKSGKYVFHVRATNSEGAWSENEYKLKVLITPPFYLTLAFKLSVIALIILLSFLFYRKQISSIRKIFKYREETIQSKAEYTAVELENSLLKEEIQKKNLAINTETARLIEKNQVLVNIKNFLSNSLIEANRDTKSKIIELHQQVVKSLEDDTNWQKYNQNIDRLQDNFISRFSSEFPDVTHKDLKICAYIRMNMTNQEIADQLNITSRSLEMARYRIRKKVKLPHKINLNDFILKY